MLVLDGYFDEIDISQLPPDFVNAKFDKLKSYIQYDNGKKEVGIILSESSKFQSIFLINYLIIR